MIFIKRLNKMNKIIIRNIVMDVSLLSGLRFISNIKINQKLILNVIIRLSWFASVVNENFIQIELF